MYVATFRMTAFVLISPEIMKNIKSPQEITGDNDDCRLESFQPYYQILRLSAKMHLNANLHNIHYSLLMHDVVLSTSELFDGTHHALKICF